MTESLAELEIASAAFPCVCVVKKVGDIQRGFVNKYIQQRGHIGLNDKEEQFLDRDLEDGRTKDSSWRIRPHSCRYQVGVPWYGVSDGDLDNNENKSRDLSMGPYAQK